MIATENDYKKYLMDADKNYQGQKTWETLFSNVDLSRQKQLAATNYDYGMAMNEAYQQAYLNEQNIRGTSLIGSAKQRLIDENTAALEQAFKTFSQQKAQATANIDANAAALNESLSTMLSERAANFKAYDEAHYAYLERLYDTYGGTELFTDDKYGLSMYLTDEIGDDGKVLTDSDGNPIKRLMTRNELYSVRTDANGENLGFIGSDDGLTIRGYDFYDKMQNWRPDSEKFSDYLRFEDFLRETNPELLSWATDVDAYNYTDAGTNTGSFKTAFGLTSTDYDYQFAERLGGLTSGELETKFQKFKDYAAEYSEIADKTSGGNRVKKNAKIAADTANELKALTDDLGITDDIEKELGVDFTTYINTIMTAKDSMYSGGDIFAQSNEAMFKAIGDSAKNQALLNADKASNLNLDIGPIDIGGGIGLITGYIGGFLKGLTSPSTLGAGVGTGLGMKSKNEDYEAQLEQAYINMVDQLVLYARNRKSELNKQYQ